MTIDRGAIDWDAILAEKEARLLELVMSRAPSAAIDEARGEVHFWRWPGGLRERLVRAKMAFIKADAELLAVVKAAESVESEESINWSVAVVCIEAERRLKLEKEGA